MDVKNLEGSDPSTDQDVSTAAAVDDASSSMEDVINKGLEVFRQNETPTSDDPDEAESSPAGDTDVEPEAEEGSDVEEAYDAEAGTPSDAEEANETEDEAGGTDPAEGPEDYSDVPFGKHPRFQRLLAERREYQQDAYRYRDVENYMAHHGLSAEEAAQSMALVGLMKTNPAEAWRQLQPVCEQLMVAAGEVLTPDLREAVEKGQMTHEMAQEMCRTRAEMARHQAALQTQQQQFQAHQQRYQEQQTEALRQHLSRTAEDWAAERYRRDPNFHSKIEAIQKEIVYLQRQEGCPTDARGVREQCARAYKNVSAQLVPPTPRPRENSKGQSRGTPRPAPETVHDAVLQALRANSRE